MTTFQAGEVVDITIKGARVVEVCRHGDGNGDDLRFTYEAKDGEAWPSAIWAQAPGVTVERVAPAEWPPRVGDLWRDNFGDLWFAVERHVDGERYVTLSCAIQKGDLWGADDQVIAEYGPLTLLHREDQQNGSQP